MRPEALGLVPKGFFFGRQRGSGIGRAYRYQSRGLLQVDAHASRCCIIGFCASSSYKDAPARLVYPFLALFAVSTKVRTSYFDPYDWSQNCLRTRRDPASPRSRAYMRCASGAEVDLSLAMCASLAEFAAAQNDSASLRPTTKVERPGKQHHPSGWLQTG